jgi:7,8-dihydropterin-6-yl-methyl-4-(beta-D-ribofuranosyl)aminobenzene 5'-phosphate synthase
VLVTVRRAGPSPGAVRRRTSPDGVVENMRRLDIDPGSIEAIVCTMGTSTTQPGSTG